MKLCIFTIVLDGMPFLEWQYECFKKLSCDWEWIIAEGTAQNGGSTSWCKSQTPRLSRDGTREFLESIHEVITYLPATSWESKDQMVNMALEYVTDPCVLMQIDVDELYNPKTIEKIVDLFTSDDSLGAIRMPCRYFVGSNLVCSGDNCWSNWKTEWERAWRANKDTTMIEHEPPKLNKLLGRTMEREEAASHKVTFDHLSWVRESQVKYKAEFYGGEYSNAVNQWKSLQENQHWPCKLSRFFPWVSGELPLVRKI